MKCQKNVSGKVFSTFGTPKYLNWLISDFEMLRFNKKLFPYYLHSMLLETLLGI